jgi:tetratricopeptide (TPR) repeat protein
MLLVMIAVVGILATRDPSAPSSSALAPDGTAAPFVSGNGAGGGTSPPPLTGTPREQADRLFDRIMRERAAGNIQAAEQFLPMGIAAYQQAGELEPDGLYHLALLQASAGQHADAVATAERILKAEPNHLLALGAAAESAEESGDSAAAGRYYERYLAAYPTEKTKTTAEYLDHSKVLAPYEEAARRFLK